MTLSVLDMIEEAYDRIQVDGRAGYDLRSARRSLDILLSEWTNRGLNLWTVEQATYALPSGTSMITLASDAYDVMDVVLRDNSVTPAFDLNLDRMSPTDYLNIPYKDMTGTPTRFLMRRTYNTTTLTVWQVPTKDYVLAVNQLKIIPTISGYTSAIQIPDRFQAALISGLAYNLSLKRNPARSAELKAYYEDDFTRAADEERDRSSMFIAPDIATL